MRLTVGYPSLRIWNKHSKDWRACNRCHLGRTAFKHVLVRGSLPADILFIGEAPGNTEDTLGLPFIGPAGRILDALIKNALLHKPYADYTYAITNILACIPRDEGGYPRAPVLEEASVCSPRVKDTIKICNPSLIVTLGAVAQRYVKKFSLVPPGVSLCDLYHPAYILRQGGENSLEFKRTLNNMAFALGELNGKT